MAEQSVQLAVEGPFIGSARILLIADGQASAILKSAATEALWLGPNGLAGDEQADRQQHGGPDRALCHYTREGYRHWRQVYPRRSADLVAGAFGENLCTRGLDETQVCLGDIWRLGEAIVQVSQPRQPCWKLNARMELPDLGQKIMACGRSGWLWRVLEPGWVPPGALMTRLQRDAAHLSIAAFWSWLYGDGVDGTALATAVEHPALTPGWRRRLRMRALHLGVL